jgi:hypothetical protein
MEQQSGQNSEPESQADIKQPEVPGANTPDQPAVSPDPDRALFEGKEKLDERLSVVEEEMLKIKNRDTEAVNKRIAGRSKIWSFIEKHACYNSETDKNAKKELEGEIKLLEETGQATGVQKKRYSEALKEKKSLERRIVKKEKGAWLADELLDKERSLEGSVRGDVLRGLIKGATGLLLGWGAFLAGPIVAPVLFAMGTRQFGEAGAHLAQGLHAQAEVKYQEKLLKAAEARRSLAQYEEKLWQEYRPQLAAAENDVERARLHQELEAKLSKDPLYSQWRDIQNNSDLSEEEKLRQFENLGNPEKVPNWRNARVAQQFARIAMAESYKAERKHIEDREKSFNKVKGDPEKLLKLYKGLKNVDTMGFIFPPKEPTDRDMNEDELDAGIAALQEKYAAVCAEDVKNALALGKKKNKSKNKQNNSGEDEDDDEIPDIIEGTLTEKLIRYTIYKQKAAEDIEKKIQGTFDAINLDSVVGLVKGFKKQEQQAIGLEGDVKDLYKKFRKQQKWAGIAGVALGGILGVPLGAHDFDSGAQATNALQSKVQAAMEVKHKLRAGLLDGIQFEYQPGELGNVKEAIKGMGASLNTGSVPSWSPEHLLRLGRGVIETHQMDGINVPIARGIAAYVATGLLGMLGIKGDTPDTVLKKDGGKPVSPAGKDAPKETGNDLKDPESDGSNRPDTTKSGDMKGPDEKHLAEEIQEYRECFERTVDASENLVRAIDSDDDPQQIDGLIRVLDDALVAGGRLDKTNQTEIFAFLADEVNCTKAAIQTAFDKIAAWRSAASVADEQEFPTPSPEPSLELKTRSSPEADQSKNSKPKSGTEPKSKENTQPKPLDPKEMIPLEIYETLREFTNEFGLHGTATIQQMVDTLSDPLTMEVALWSRIPSSAYKRDKGTGRYRVGENLEIDRSLADQWKELKSRKRSDLNQETWSDVTQLTRHLDNIIMDERSLLSSEQKQERQQLVQVMRDAAHDLGVQNRLTPKRLAGEFKKAINNPEQFELYAPVRVFERINVLAFNGGSEGNKEAQARIFQQIEIAEQVLNQEIANFDPEKYKKLQSRLRKKLKMMDKELREDVRIPNREERAEFNKIMQGIRGNFSTMVNKLDQKLAKTRKEARQHKDLLDSLETEAKTISDRINGLGKALVSGRVIGGDIIKNLGDRLRKFKVQIDELGNRLTQDEKQKQVERYEDLKKQFEQQIILPKQASGADLGADVESVELQVELATDSRQEVVDSVVDDVETKLNDEQPEVDSVMMEFVEQQIEIYEAYGTITEEFKQVVALLEDHKSTEMTEEDLIRLLEALPELVSQGMNSYLSNNGSSEAFGIKEESEMDNNLINAASLLTVMLDVIKDYIPDIITNQAEQERLIGLFNQKVTEFLI